MKLEDIHFPVYRKYKNNKSYFKIINPRLFEEIQVIGSRHLVIQKEALVYPDVLFIEDLVSNTAIAQKITEQEYRIILEQTISEK